MAKKKKRAPKEKKRRSQEFRTDAASPPVRVKKTGKKQKQKARKRIQILSASDRPKAARALAQADRDLDEGNVFRNLMAREGVNGVWTGYKWKNGRMTNEAAIIVLVEKKFTDDDFTNRVVHPARRLPERIGKTLVDVVEGEFTNSFANGPGHSPISPGIVIGPGHSANVFGTHSCIVYTPQTQSPRLLTNAHVVIRDLTRQQFRQQGATIMQPPRGRSRPSTNERVIGKALRSSEKWGWGGLVDCALIMPDSSIISQLPPFSTTLPVSRLTDADRVARTRVRVLGVFSRGIGVIASVSSEPITVSGVSFRDQILIVDEQGGKFTLKGDSGALLRRVDNNEVVGLIHGLTTGGLSIACHMQDVQNKLQFI